jgi:hypothetical protein
VPCCNALCTGAGGLTCTSTDPAQCACTQAP